MTPSYSSGARSLVPRSLRASPARRRRPASEGVLLWADALVASGGRQARKGSAETSVTFMLPPSGSWYSRVSPTCAPSSAAPSGRVRRDDLQVAVAALLAGAEQHRLGVVVAVVADLQHHAGGGGVGVGGGDADLRGAQQLLQLADAGLLLALLLARGVVAAVLLEVALLAAGVDLGGDDGAVRDQLVEFVLEPVVGLLGQPGHLRVRHRHHSSSLSGPCDSRTRSPAARPPVEDGPRSRAATAPSKEKHDPPAGRVMPR